ncbi:glycosyltransferase family 2 protein [Pedobacter sp.]|uniref:glycosyltransferase family 2 protein n=1 Tax=Pedobacter sp. TaxID=1411316 RepID=UPI003D7F3436
MKVSIVTIVLNCEKYIADCIDSVLIQDYQEIELIIIDGKSTDSTIPIIKSYLPQVSYFISVADQGFYSALNQALNIATGDVIGILNADDVLADAHVISTIVEKFKNNHCEAVYGNLNYTKRDDVNAVVRTWRSNSFQRNAVHYGWMPPHPTIYIKKEVYERLGDFSMDFGHSSDYELVLRFFYKHHISAVFVDKIFVKMRIGGMSNNSLQQRLKACIADYKAMCVHQVPYPLIALVGKKIRKIEQYF